ncbi:hypothetical protein J1G42_05940 [Cellulomonas sp. zg-ZUI222]|uniref:hypothetical protein n=1 Tax=Cellulomonas wangleii TaxID=2816956 RepID=UPI001A93FAA3|nr:hypothetical protein [Cellulomonas wangleii]MBO0920364.1 hypothetical protein [Cellulomonas wangleii]
MTAKTIATEAATLKRQLQADISAAQTHRDPNLSPEGLSAKRAELTKSARERHAAALSSLRTRMEAEASTTAEQAEKVRPQADADTLARKWGQVRMRLDAAIPLQRIVAKADAETLAAIREYAPTWFEVQHEKRQPSGLTRTDADVSAAMRQLTNSIDARLIEIGDATTAEAIKADREARAAVAEFDNHAAYVDGVTSGRGADALGLAVAAAMQSQAATAGLDAE